MSSRLYEIYQNNFNDLVEKVSKLISEIPNLAKGIKVLIK